MTGRERLPLLALFFLCACSTPEQRANISHHDPDWGLWKDHVHSKAEIRADDELKGLQARIDSGDLPKIQFDFDSANLRPESHKTLAAVADWSLRHPRYKLRVRAHTCDLGGEEYNQKLSERRSRSVSNYLAGLGVPPPFIRATGAGATEPLVENVTEANRERNRRVEFKIEDRDWDSIY